MEIKKGEEIVDYLFDSIKKFYNKNNHIVSVLGLPQSKQKVFQKLLIELDKENKSVLYVLGNENDKRYVIEECNDIKVDFIEFGKLNEVKKRYYLVIFDDITSLTETEQEEKLKLFDKIKEITKRMIVYSVENMVKSDEIIDIAPMQIEAPFIEPRVIQTRVNLCEDIPYILYEYLNWFIREKKKIIIYVPNEEILNNVYVYYQKKIKLKYIEIVPISKNEDKKIIKDVLKTKNEATIIITDYIYASLKDTNINSAIVLFADSEYYSYQKLLFLCGEIYRINKEIPEVLLVSKTESKAMDEVRQITRNINKRVWRINSLNY